MNYSISKHLSVGRQQRWRPVFAESGYHRWIIPLPSSYLLATSSDDGYWLLIHKEHLPSLDYSPLPSSPISSRNKRALTIGQLFHFQAAICWPLAVTTASFCWYIHWRALTIGELFHFQAAICWPLAVMTASFLEIHSLKSTYHGGIIPLPSSYLLAAGCDDGQCLVSIKSTSLSYNRWIIPFPSCPMACRSIKEHLPVPWENYSTSKQQFFAGR